MSDHNPILDPEPDPEQAEVDNFLEKLFAPKRDDTEWVRRTHPDPEHDDAA